MELGNALQVDFFRRWCCDVTFLSALAVFAVAGICVLPVGSARARDKFPGN